MTAHHAERISVEHAERHELVEPVGWGPVHCVVRSGVPSDEVHGETLVPLSERAAHDVHEVGRVPTTLQERVDLIGELLVELFDAHGRTVPEGRARVSGQPV
ncbi:MAG: hypothetical protein RI900_127 [Actinomycetota bacterium]